MIFMATKEINGQYYKDFIAPNYINNFSVREVGRGWKRGFKRWKEIKK